jgi:hypothetical protein
MSLTTDKNDPDLKITEASGMQKKYLVLSDAERAKGFVRPVMRSYKHVGLPAPEFPLEDLTDEGHERYDEYGYVKYEPYPKGHNGSALGKYWTQEKLNRINNGCGSVTTMGQDLAETYARDPSFYGATFCSHCREHFPVGKDGEFVWLDTNERVGT